MPKTYKSEALAAVHEMMEGLHEAGAIDKQTMREFDEALPCARQSPFSPRKSRLSARRSMSRSPSLRAI
jgi:putative transcriptional regulator